MADGPRLYKMFCEYNGHLTSMNTILRYDYAENQRNIPKHGQFLAMRGYKEFMLPYAWSVMTYPESHLRIFQIWEVTTTGVVTPITVGIKLSHWYHTGQAVSKFWEQVSMGGAYQVAKRDDVVQLPPGTVGIPDCILVERVDRIQVRRGHIIIDHEEVSVE